MNLSDTIIIYLTCGAPFGVYYFLQNRKQIDPTTLWLKSFLNFIFWIPFAFLLLRRNNFLKIPFVNFGRTTAEANRFDEILYSLQKRIEKSFSESDLKISIYELREIVERYVGLTLTKPKKSLTISEREKEIFRVSKNKNTELGAVCLTRRNRNRLSFHHIEARKDFLRLIEKLFETSSEHIELEQAAIELVNFLQDYDALQSLEKIFDSSQQSDAAQIVKTTEKELWKPETRKPSTIKLISIPLQTMTATANSRKKD